MGTGAEVNAAVSGHRHDHAFDSDLTHNTLFVLLVQLGVKVGTYMDLLCCDYGMTHHSAAFGSLTASPSGSLLRPK